jgi:pyrroline-5-carboxylate reductase
MGGAMLRGWAAQSIAQELCVFEPNPTDEIAGLIGDRGWQLNPPLAQTGVLDVLVIAVKPQSFGPVSDSVVRTISGPATLAISIMAGITLERLKEACGTGRVVRAMPNTPGQIGKGITAWCGTPDLDAADRAMVERLLAPLGAIEKLASERQMDAVTAVSGSGPAYLFLLTETLAAAAEAEGLERGLAERLARATVTGSAALMENSGLTPHELRKEVTSPGGTTEAGLDVLTGGGGLISLMRRAVEAAAARSRQLGRA